MKRIFAGCVVSAAVGLIAFGAFPLGSVVAHDGKDHGKAVEGAANIQAISQGEYVSDPTHAYVTFSYNHLGFSNPTVGFRESTVRVNIDPVSLNTLAVDAVIKVASLESFVPGLNDHLLSDGFFDAANHPDIQFSAIAADLVHDNKGTLDGVLRIKGIEKPVRLDVVLNKVGQSPITKKETLGVSATGVIKRSDWGLDAYAPAVSDEVNVRIELELQKSEDA